MNPKQSGRRRFLKEGSMLAAGLAVGAIGIRPASGQTPGAATPERRPEDLHAYGQPSHFENGVVRTREGTQDYGFRTPLQDQLGIITPASLHFILSHQRDERGIPYDPPDLDPRKHRLLIHGLVDRTLVLSLDDLKRLPSISRFHFVECNANSNPTGFWGAHRRAPTATVADTHGLTSSSLWTGVPLSLLLEQAGVKKSASWMLVEGSE